MQPLDVFDLAVIPAAFVLATLLERMIEYLVTPLFVKNGWDKLYLKYVSAAFGIVLNLLTGLNLLPTVLTNPWVGRIVTGLIIGGWANYVHDRLTGHSDPITVLGTLMTGDVEVREVDLGTNLPVRRPPPEQEVARTAYGEPTTARGIEAMSPEEMSRFTLQVPYPSEGDE